MPLNQQEIAELLANESFINYCKGAAPEDVARWEAFSAASRQNRALADTAREQFLAMFHALAEADLAEQESRLAGKLFPASDTPVVPMKVPVGPRRLRSMRRWAAVMLPLVLAGGAWLFLKTSHSPAYNTVPGERKNFHLPDGSFVRLNAGSTLKLGKDFGGRSRDIYLEGEAYFDVKHNQDAPFIVHAPNMDVRAVGTAFNVRAYAGDDSSETVLVQGIVEVTLKGGEERKITLRPAQKIRWKSTAAPAGGRTALADSFLITGLTRTFDGEIPETGWIHNKLIFEDQTLSAIAVKLERWFGARVVITDEILANYRFTGTFERESIGEVLDVCRESRHFNYRITPGETPVVTIFR